MRDTIDPSEKPSSHRSQTDQTAGNTPGRLLGGDERAVSEVLGAVLLFGILIALLVLIQVNAVPAENQQVEFEHNQRVEQDMLGLDRAILQSGMLDVTGSSEIELAARYPQRFFLLNPPVGSGTIETLAAGSQLKIKHAQSEFAPDYWDGTERLFDTSLIRYRPNYNEYANAPMTLYEHNTLVNQFTDAVVPVDSASFIEGNQITLVAVEGEFSRSATSGYALETAALSAPAQSTTISNVDTKQIVITIPTTLTKAEWNEILSDEDNAEATAERAMGGYNEVDITLDPGTYELRMARVRVGESVGSGDLEPTYITPTEALEQESIRLGETKELRVQVHDEYNNPTSGTVTFTATDGQFVRDGEEPTETLTVGTDENGVARVVFEPDTSGTATVTARLKPEPNEPYEELEFTIPVRSQFDPDGNDNGVSNINPYQDIVLEDINHVKGSGQSNDNVELTFRNVNGPTQQITEVRLLFYLSSNGNNPDSMKVWKPDGTESVSVDIGPPHTGWQPVSTLGIEVPYGNKGNRVTVTLEFPGIGNGNLGDDIFGLAIGFEDSAGNYFVQVQ